MTPTVDSLDIVKRMLGADEGEEGPPAGVDVRRLEWICGRFAD